MPLLLLILAGLLLAPGLAAATQPATATPTPALPTLPTPDSLGIGEITFNSNRTYAFPVAAAPTLYTWTRYHWDGTNAVDIEARFGLDYDEFLAVTSAPLVAMTSGTVFAYDGEAGGTGCILQGDDGLDYYYGHMSARWVADGARVYAGQPIGAMGNTGQAAQFIEPHLHFAIGPRGSLLQNVEPPAVNAAEWLFLTFGLDWDERTPPDVPPSLPSGWPVREPGIEIVTTFADSTESLPQPAITLGLDDTALAALTPDNALDVYATLDGEINVMRWTAVYGTRIQIANRASQATVVISGVNEWLVQDSDEVHKGDLIARWNPHLSPDLHYMIFQDSVIIDPTPLLGPSPGEGQ
ncbi:MAG: M23 family metallopeptidase [Chloroflexi bacterium]|nr:M23 family metallopeptidase [Chloroflexota bacterium]